MKNYLDLTGKVALITGGSSGIGAATAVLFAELGAAVAIGYHGNEAGAKKVHQEIEKAGGKATAIRADVRKSAEIRTMIETVTKQLGPIDILVNNAGVGHFGKLSDTTVEDFDRLFAINTRGSFLVTLSALQRMNEGGRVINISSGASKRPATVFGAYAMSKAALDVMTLALAAELGPRGITVNSVAPGWTATEANAAARQDAEIVRNVESQTALGRLGMPDDIARVVAFLASDDASWVTGQYIEASGGFKLL